MRGYVLELGDADLVLATGLVGELKRLEREALLAVGRAVADVVTLNNHHRSVIHTQGEDYHGANIGQIQPLDSIVVSIENHNAKG